MTISYLSTNYLTEESYLTTCVGDNFCAHFAKLISKLFDVKMKNRIFASAVNNGLGIKEQNDSLQTKAI